MKEPHYRDPAVPIQDRVEDLLSRLSLEEKAGQLTQYFYTSTGEPEELPEGFDVESLPPEHRAYIGLSRKIEDAVASGRVGSLLFVRKPDLANRLQRLAVEETAHGIPLLFGFDVVHGWRTIFPAPIAMAATWSPALVEAAQTVAAREARSAGVHWTFAPMVDIARDARWGRIFEGAGEDPFLGAKMAAAQVRGFQGDLGHDRLLAGAKHFVAYGAARGGRDYDDVDVSDSELWNVYLPPFEAAIAAGASNVMGAYMDFGGVPVSGNRRLLTEVLREDLGFDGFVVSDANAVRSLVTQHFAKDSADAAGRAINAGLDMEMAMMDPAFASLPDAVVAGVVNVKDLDVAVRRVLTAKFRLGLFERPYAAEDASAGILSAPSHRKLAEQVAVQSIVLLKNEKKALPFRPELLQRIALVGPLAAGARDTLGPWVFEHDVSETSTLEQGLRDALGNVQIDYVSGASIPERVNPTPFDEMDHTVERTPDGYDDETAIEQAVDAARSADVAVVVVGQRQNQIGERASTSTLELPGRQQEQLERIHATGTPIILVLMTGRPLDIRWADENVSAIVQAWYPGTRGGHAVASILTGAHSPSGRLPFAWPRHVGQVPLTYAHYRTFDPDAQDARYWDGNGAALYPFGHGLSYGSCRYSNLRLSSAKIRRGEQVAVTVDVQNTSDRDVEEVVQLYIHQRFGTSTRPVKELKGFRRVSLGVGEVVSVEFTLGPDELRYWSSVTRSRIQDRTLIQVWVGGSSASDEMSSEFEVV